MLIVRVIKRLYRNLLIKLNPVSYARKIGVMVGDNARIIGMDDRTFGSEPYLITLGDHVTVTGQVKFINHDGGVWVFRENENDIELFRPIIVGNNVFIGYRSIIMPGARIGNNVVIGAGSIVIGDIPDGCVAAGVPAKVIRSLDDYRNRIDSFTVKRTWKNEIEKRNTILNLYKKDLQA